MGNKLVLFLKGRIYELPLDGLKADPQQPRKVMDEQALAELTTVPGTIINSLAPLLARPRIP